MRHILFLLIMNILFLPIISGQQADFGQIVMPIEQQSRNFEEYLVQLAWSNAPANKALEHRLKIAGLQTNQARKSWMKDVGFAFNFNEGHLKSSETGNLFLPKYNFNATVNLGSLITRPIDTKIAQQEEHIALANINQQKLQIRAEVLRRYEAYELAVKTLSLRSQAEEAMETAASLAAKLFKEGKITFTEYNSSLVSLHQLQEQRLISDINVKLAIINLEEMIGIKWERAVKRKEKE